MKRADQLLVQQGLARSRTQAQRWIDHGRVEYRIPDSNESHTAQSNLVHNKAASDPNDSSSASQWQKLKKAGLKLMECAQFRIEPEAEDRFVSRGGLKLFNALQQLACDVSGQHWLDIGQSTGGFTDCLLQQGAAFVTGVDVGHNQLVAELQQHPQVASLEGINARELSSPQKLFANFNDEDFLFDGICIDVSFISQVHIVPGLESFLKPGAAIVALVKPQFELQPEQIGKGGLVSDATLYLDVEQKITQLYQSSGFEVLDYIASSIKGGDGNCEFFIYARKRARAA